MKTNNTISDKDKLFNDLPESKVFQDRLCKFLESTSLVEFLIQIETKYKIKDWEKWLYKTLDYLYPLIKEWKLEVKIMDYRKFSHKKKMDWKEIVGEYHNVQEYKQDDADVVIERIKNEWLKIYNWDDEEKKRRELDDFWTIQVQFKLPEWFYTY